MNQQKKYPENYWKQIYSNNAKQGGEEYFVSTWTKEGLDANIDYFKAYFQSELKVDNSTLSVLDIGCGPGTFSRLLADWGFTVYGVDYSEEMVDLARKSSSRNIDFQTAGIYQLPFPDNHFDTIICLGVFQVLEKPLDGIKEIKRVLKPGGKVFITTLNKFSLSGIISLFKKRDFSPNRFNPFKLKPTFVSEGFNEIGLKGVYFFPKKISFLTNYIYKNKIYNFLNKYYKVFNFLSNSFQIEAKK